MPDTVSGHLVYRPTPGKSQMAAIVLPVHAMMCGTDSCLLLSYDLSTLYVTVQLSVAGLATV